MSSPTTHLFLGSPVDPARSALMRRVRGRNTQPEVALRKELWKKDVRYRCNVTDLPGWPDIANKKRRAVVFVDGCFWHGCPKHGTIPKTRRAYWTSKIERNRRRRKTVLKAYGSDWSIFQVFECELRENKERVVAQILAAFKGVSS